MTLPYVKIAHTSLTPTEVTVICTGITVKWKNNNDSKPNVNMNTITEVNTQSFENPTYTLSNVRFLADTTTLQYSHLLKLSKLQYNGSNAPVLKVHYGKGDAEKDLVGSDETSTSIKFVIDDWLFPIDVTTTDKGYMPIANINLRETL